MALPINRATLTIVKTIGVLFALGGMNHGLFEILQGNVSTGDVLIAAIGEKQRMWVHGEEGAFTLLPTFLASGIATWVIGISIVIWSLKYLDTRHGPRVYLILFILLFLTGGGVAQVLFFSVAYAAATQIRKPLVFWRRMISAPLRRRIASSWKGLLIFTVLIGLFNLWVATTGWVPGLANDDQVLSLMLVTLGIWYLCFLFTFIAGFAADIEHTTAATDS